MVARTPSRTISPPRTPTRSSRRTSEDCPTSSSSVSASLALNLDFSRLHLGEDNTAGDNTLNTSTPVAVNTAVHTDSESTSQISRTSTNFNISVTVNGQAPNPGNVATPGDQTTAAIEPGPIVNNIICYLIVPLTSSLQIATPAADIQTATPNDAPCAHCIPRANDNEITVNERGFVDDRDLGTPGKWYSVTKGVKIGIFRSWSRTDPQVKDRHRIRLGACWSKHDTRALAEADFLENFEIGNVLLL
ncbi:hypothetical protein EIP91_001982 [Steccherinum ochraceum]|uniref:Ribonuclease H1 N-terminal domain-containing protein n=1 Tax=Steccherinum ochraceum TaxID=92696 RepID=A0A4R0RF81_9APHY|nr:hypothetical protein EIP91_001982 [Steccherinum ochraceum]